MKYTLKRAPQGKIEQEESPIQRRTAKKEGMLSPYRSGGNPNDTHQKSVIKIEEQGLSSPQNNKREIKKTIDINL